MNYGYQAAISDFEFFEYFENLGNNCQKLLLEKLFKKTLHFQKPEYL